MANIHIREKDPKNKTINCIFHFAVPTTNNAIGTPWNEVIEKAKAPTPLMSDNDTTENANISSGSVLEYPETVRFSSTNLTQAQRIAEINAAYNTLKTSIFETLADELDYFGHTIG